MNLSVLKSVLILGFTLSASSSFAQHPGFNFRITDDGVQVRALSVDGMGEWSVKAWQKRFGTPDRSFKQQRHKRVCERGFCGTKIQVHAAHFLYYDQLGIELVSGNRRSIDAIIVQLESTGHQDKPNGLYQGDIKINGTDLRLPLDTLRSMRARSTPDVLKMDPLGCGEECHVMKLRMKPQLTAEDGEYQLIARLREGGLAITYGADRRIKRLRVLRRIAPHRDFPPPPRRGPAF